MKRPEIKALTGLRGICAVWVAALHFTSAARCNAGWVIAHGYLAVDIFLILSGYVLARSYAGHEGSYIGYLWRRWWRIFPAHLFVLLAAVAIIPSSPLPLLIEAALMHRWAPANPWIPIHAVNFPDWSLSCEWAASIALPAFSLLCLRNRATVAAIAGCAFATIMIIAIRHHPTGRAEGLWPLARCGSDFGLGVLAWRANIGRFSPQSIAIALSATPVVWIGEISYSLYLVHAPLMDLLGPTWAWAVATPCAAIALHILIERPARNFGRRRLTLSSVTALDRSMSQFRT